MKPKTSKLFVDNEELEVEIEHVEYKVKVISKRALKVGQKCKIKCSSNSVFDTNLVVEKDLGEDTYLLRYDR